MNHFALLTLTALVAATAGNQALLADEPTPEQRYELGPDSFRQEGVPQGKITSHAWNTSKIYPGTIRRYAVYVPAQYRADEPAALMVFQDGHKFLQAEGDFRAPVVFDNLIAKGDMPITIGVFVDPGHRLEQLPAKPGANPKPANRSVEYDTLSDDYARFLLEEILPEVSRDYNITGDPNRRAICGNSSGGICAFTVAWERPDSFRKVLSHVGSFTNIRGGHVYPALIRKPPGGQDKPLRVLLQDGSNDLDNEHGNWFLGNQQMARALEFRHYDVKTVFGHGGHNGNHGGAIFPDSLRWLWRE